MKTTKTKPEDILFRSSKIGLLAGGLIRHGLTAKQREKMEQLELLKITPIGLTEKQASDLKVWDEKLESGTNLTPAQMEKRDDYQKRLVTPRGLTPNQEAELQKLKEINSRPPELSDGAKTYIKEVWLENEKGFKENIDSKYLRKGKQAEEDGINLVAVVDNIYYQNNNDKPEKGRMTINNLTGACDIEYYDKESDTKEIHDIKCAWNPRTFMSMNLTTLYEWQGRAYMYLFNADVFKLRCCLVDCPPDVLLDEYRRFCYQQGIIDDSLEEYKPLIEQFYANYMYEESELYTHEERVKTFTIERDYQLEQIMIEAIKLGVEYYQTITLNMI